MSLYRSPPPLSQEELLQRTRALAGRTLADLANEHGEQVPTRLLHDKGWVGQFIERLLGANAASQAEPDFMEIGVELKTIPIDTRARPLESTYVCTVDLQPDGRENWQNCWLKRKLSTVLWLPVLVDKNQPIAQRRIGSALLWSPDEREGEQLRRDWEELMDMIRFGELERISSRYGEVLQIRPKAANSRVLCPAIGPEGETVMSNPRGFYLRPAFTAALLQRHLL